MLLRQQGTGGGGGAVTAAVAICDASDAVNDLVYISGPKVGAAIRVSKVDITDQGKMPSIGAIQSKSTSTDCVVFLRGTLTVSGASDGDQMFAGVNGEIAVGGPGRPSSGFRTYQHVGFGTATDTIQLNPDSYVSRLKAAI